MAQPSPKKASLHKVKLCLQLRWLSYMFLQDCVSVHVSCHVHFIKSMMEILWKRSEMKEMEIKKITFIKIMTLKIIDINMDNKLYNNKLLLCQLPLMMNIEEHLSLNSKTMD